MKLWRRVGELSIMAGYSGAEGGATDECEANPWYIDNCYQVLLTK